MPRLATLALFSLLPTIGSAGLQLNNRAAMTMIQSRYDGLLKASNSKDVQELSKFIASDYSSGDFRSPLTKSKYLDSVKNSHGNGKTTSMKVLTVIVNRNKASALVDSVGQRTFTDKKGKHLIVVKARCMDTWEKTSYGWQLRHSNVVRRVETKDGKVMPQAFGR